MAWTLVRHALTVIFNNLGYALRATLVPAAVVIGGFLLLYIGTGLDNFDQTEFSATDMEEFQSAAGAFALIVVILLPLSLFAFGWMAVVWHRFVLLEEYPGWVPRIEHRLIWPYVGKTILLALLIALVMIPVLMLIMPVFSATGAVGANLFGVLLNVVVGLIWFRLAIVLPGIALGQSHGFREAWAITKGMNSTLVGVVVILSVFQVLAGMAVETIYQIGYLPGLVADVAVQWLVLVLGISILTTLYGHLIEGRDLPT